MRELREKGRGKKECKGEEKTWKEGVGEAGEEEEREENSKER